MFVIDESTVAQGKSFGLSNKRTQLEILFCYDLFMYRLHMGFLPEMYAFTLYNTVQYSKICSPKANQLQMAYHNANNV